MNIKNLIALDNPFRLVYHFFRAFLANIFYGFPSKNMIVIGVTGTNGKTTTTNIIAKGLQESWKKVFMFSTINYSIDDQEYVNTTKMTSPDPFLLQSLLSKAKKKWCEVAVIETSSHALTMHRVRGIAYDIAILTNITQDHLDLHRTMQRYVRAKLKLFKGLISSGRKKGVRKVAIINEETDYKEEFLEEAYDILTTYGFDQNANLRAENISSSLDGMRFQVRIPGKQLNIHTHLYGKHNVYNILAAIAVLISFGISGKKIEASIANILTIPGRLEAIQSEEKFKVFIDYAHTADALENVLSTIRSLQWVHRILTVFGCTGDRDRSKRPIMGEVVSRLSDYVVLTQDDDYSEPTQQIIKDVLPGINRKEGEDFWIIPDREAAIRTALLNAKDNDVVLIAGKWDERVLMTNLGPREYSDREVVQRVLKEMDDNTFL